MNGQLDVKDLPPYTQVGYLNDNGVLNAFGPTDFAQKFFSGGVIPAVGTELVLVLDKVEIHENGNTAFSVVFKKK